MRAVVLAVFVGLGCQGAPGASRDGSTAAGTPATGGAGAGAPAGGFGGFGGAAGSSPDASLSSNDAREMVVDAGTCPFNMGATACAPAGASCSWANECVARRCDCVGGAWSCSEQQLPCGGTCPAPQQAQCGAACDGSITGCLCRSGGGPNYSSCSCANGRWACSTGH